MGKAKRSKNKKAAAQIGNPGAYVENNGVSSTGLKVALAIIALIVVASLLFTFVQSTGLLLRTDYGYKSDNFEIDGAMMQYLYHAQIYNFIDLYGQYISYYEMMGYSIVDFSKSLKTQKYSATAASLFGEFEGTWFDFFWSNADVAAKQILVFCEAAKEEGTFDSYAAEIEADLDATIEEIKHSAEHSEATVGQYIEYFYGDGVRLSNVEDMERLTLIASKYYEAKSEEFLNAIKDDDVNKFHEENKSDYLYADFVVASFTASLGKNPTDEEKEEFYKDVEEAKKHAEAVAALETVDEIKEYLVGYWFDESFEDSFNDAFEAAVKKETLKDEDKPTGEKLEEIRAKMKEFVLTDSFKEELSLKYFGSETKLDKLLDDLTRDLIETCKKGLESIVVEGQLYGESTDMEKWLFDDETKVGDKGTFYGSDDNDEDKFNKEKDTSYTVNVFHVTRTAYVKDTKVVHFGHILLTEKGPYNTEAKQKEKLIAIKEAFEKGEKTKEAFEALAKDLTEDSSVFYEDTQPGDMVDEMNDWLFDPARKDGDVTILKTKYGYHLTYYVGQGKEIWFVDSKEDLHTETVDKWYEDLKKELEGNININEKITSKISEGVAISSYIAH